MWAFGSLVLILWTTQNREVQLWCHSKYHVYPIKRSALEGYPTSIWAQGRTPKAHLLFSWRLCSISQSPLSKSAAWTRWWWRWQQRALTAYDVPDIVPTALYTITQSSRQLYEAGTVTLPILKVGKMRNRVAGQVVQGHRGGKWWPRTNPRQPSSKLQWGYFLSPQVPHGGLGPLHSPLSHLFFKLGAPSTLNSKDLVCRPLELGHTLLVFS